MRFQHFLSMDKIELSNSFYEEKIPFIPNREKTLINKDLYPLGKYELIEVVVTKNDNLQKLYLHYKSNDKSIHIAAMNFIGFKWLTKDFKLSSILDLDIKFNEIIEKKIEQTYYVKNRGRGVDIRRVQYGIAKSINIIGYENAENLIYPINQYEGFIKYFNDNSLTAEEKKIEIYNTLLIENAKPFYSSVILENPLIGEIGTPDLSYLLIVKKSGYY